jgi:malonyl-CoA/methylmalonyl-CoA synthetase
VTVVAAPDWAVHLPPGMNSSTVDLAAGRSLPGAFTSAWRQDPGRTILSTPDGMTLSASGLESRSADVAGRYAAAGLVPGDRVLLSANTSVEMVLAYVGALRAGLTVVPANSAYTPVEMASLVDAARPALAVLDEPARLASSPLRTVTPDLAGLPVARTDVALDEAQPGDPALIIYTSGTTGQPKGVSLSHANLLASAHAVRLAWRWSPEDNLALCLPLFHVHGLGVGLHGTLVTGAQATLIPRFEPSAVAEAIDRGSTLLFGVPTMYHRLSESPHLSSLGRLRLAVSGSAPLPAELHETVRAATGQVVLERYGMTETIMLVSNPYDGERRPGTVGLPLPGVEVRLVLRGVGASIDSADVGSAEIEVRGPNVIAGYLDNPSASAAAFTADGWFRTGDLGTLDEDGYLRISGRAKELIITGGYNVYPREVEELLRSHASVADAAVVGAPSARWGETVVAFVVPAADCLAGSADLLSTLDAFAAAHLVSYKRPREWRVVESIPRNALGKILRHKLVA